MYRGKRKDNSEWVEGYYSYNPFMKRAEIFSFDDVRCYVFEVIPETVGQYTEVNASGGKKIFEGDIIKCSMIYEIGCYPYEKIEIRKVEYIEGCFCPLYEYRKGTAEIIGNVYDNPELIPLITI